MSARPLSRAAAGLGTPPPRIVHLGLGAFHRAHQAWYTAHADDAAAWGIAAFTGRSPREADALAAQECLYTVAARGADGDEVEVVGSIVEAHHGADVDALRGLVARPEVAVVTLTVTEAGYRLLPDGTPDPGDTAMVADLAVLRARMGEPATPLGRLVVALDARRRACAGPIAVVPCDNVPGNGPWVREGVLALASALDDALAAWIASDVSFVSTSVDRITPRRAEGDESLAAAAGWIDGSPIVTEPFSDWILSGGFPAGRPAWETAGARLVDDIEPFENRKLWMLNGAHTVLASLGRLRGHATVADAIADPVCRELVEDVWDAAARHLPADVDAAAYRVALVERFANPRIVHLLEQIAQDSSVKLAARIVPVARLELAAGGEALPAAAALGAWIAAVRRCAPVPDAREHALGDALLSTDPIRALVAAVDPDLAAHPQFVAEVRIRAAALADVPTTVAP
ncbi:mannitol dehydrogenase family protein [Demequina rhizosphaerae]|uniref:mannitol dehydrogenase family protein n=1 Tax=Demequina rhizosphaerae TaxID=1638985 RepID=UPI000784464E|nr:mannitol dehydrogenase family protein [Demequina rhizosphaerae]